MSIDLRTIFSLMNLYEDIKKTYYSFKKKPEKRNFSRPFRPIIYEPRRRRSFWI